MYLAAKYTKGKRLAMIALAVVFFLSFLWLGFSFVGRADAVDPVVYTFNTQMTLKKFGGWNSVRALENGYLRITAKDNVNDDGFQFDDTFSQNEYIDMSQYTHVKFRVKREHCEYVAIYAREISRKTGTL